MLKPTISLLSVLLVLVTGYFTAFDGQTTQKLQVQLHYEGRNLYTRVNGKQYLIDEVAPGGPSDARALIDPRQQNVYYVQNTGCGFENEGTTLLASDVYGRAGFPILSRCEILTPVKFLNFSGETYLLIKEENGATAYGTSFWLFNVGAKRFEVHAEGQLTQLRNGNFSYGFFDESETLKPLGIVTIQTLIKRGSPLRLLPRQPTRALTKDKNAKLIFTDSYCSPISNGESRTIEDAGSQVLIAGDCPDGDYEVYFAGSRGKIAKRDLNPLVSNQIVSGPDEPLGDLDFRKRDEVLQARYQKFNSQWTKSQISKTQYLAALRMLREKELRLYAAAKQHDFKDQAEYNYWYIERPKSPSKIEMELNKITGNGP